MGLGKLLLNLIFGKGSYKKVKSEVERDMKNSPFFNEMKRRAEIVDSKEFKMWRQSLKEEDDKNREKYILKLSREEIKRDIESIPKSGLTEYQRYWKDYLVRHPEIKTNQPELYNKILMMCDVAEELKTKKCEKIGEND